MQKLENNNIFSELDTTEKKHILNFFQESFLEEWQNLLTFWNSVKNVYFLQKGQVVVTDKDWKWLGFFNQPSIIGVSIIYDYSKKNKISNVNLKTFSDCVFFVIPEDIIKSITDKDRVIFSKVINQIKNEKELFSQWIIL